MRKSKRLMTIPVPGGNHNKVDPVAIEPPIMPNHVITVDQYKNIKSCVILFLSKVDAFQERISEEQVVSIIKEAFELAE